MKMMQEGKTNTLEMNVKIEIISKAIEIQNNNQIATLILKLLGITKLTLWVLKKNKNDKRTNQ